MTCLKAAKFQMTLMIKERIQNKMNYLLRKPRKLTKRRKLKHDQTYTTIDINLNIWK